MGASVRKTRSEPRSYPRILACEGVARPPFQPVSEVASFLPTLDRVETGGKIMSVPTTRSRRTRKIAAIAAGTLVVGVGATYTLATWTDSEWVWGGAAGDAPGIGTSIFEVQQDTSSPFTGPGSFADFETNPGDVLVFSTGALALSPGDTVYAPVALRTTTASSAGNVELQGAVNATGIDFQDDDEELWDAVRVTVHTATGDTPPSACAPDFDAAGWGTIVSGAELATVADSGQGLEAAAASTQHYCFALTLPAGSSSDLQGRTIAPAWEFASESTP